MKVWACAQFYKATGRLSSAWIEIRETSPDQPKPCNPDRLCEIMGRKGETCADDVAHTPFPFNDMGGKVIGGYDTEEEAWAALAALDN